MLFIPRRPERKSTFEIQFRNELPIVRAPAIPLDDLAGFHRLRGPHKKIAYNVSFYPKPTRRILACSLYPGTFSRLHLWMPSGRAFFLFYRKQAYTSFDIREDVKSRRKTRPKMYFRDREFASSLKSRSDPPFFCIQNFDGPHRLYRMYNLDEFQRCHRAGH